MTIEQLEDIFFNKDDFNISKQIVVYSDEFQYYIQYEKQPFSYFNDDFINIGYIISDFINNFLVKDASKKHYEDLLFLIPHIEYEYIYKLENALMKINKRKLYKRYEDRILAQIILLDIKNS